MSANHLIQTLETRPPHPRPPSLLYLKSRQFVRTGSVAVVPAFCNLGGQLCPTLLYPQPLLRKVKSGSQPPILALLSQRKSWQNPKIQMISTGFLFTLGKGFVRSFIDTRVSKYEMDNHRELRIFSRRRFPFATEFPRKVAKVLSHRIEGSGWNFCTTVAFRQQAVWRGRRSLPLPPRVGVVKPDKRRRATLGGGDMPKAIHAHLLLFPRTREHLKPTLTPPSSHRSSLCPAGVVQTRPPGCCVGNQRHLVRTTMIVNSTFEQYWQQSGVVAALTVQSIASRLALMAAPKVE